MECCTKSTSSLLAIALASSLCGSAFAQRGEETIVLLPEGVELPDVVTNTIDLPKDENGAYRASEEAIAQSAKGIAIANAAREDGRTFGEQMATAAKENREVHTRSQMPDLSDLRPDHVPNNAAVPELPSNPRCRSDLSDRNDRSFRRTCRQTQPPATNPVRSGRAVALRHNTPVRMWTDQSGPSSYCSRVRSRR